MPWILLVSLFSTTVLGEIWSPHQKEIWGLIRRAEKTPEMQVHYKYEGLEKIENELRYTDINYNCNFGLKSFCRYPENALLDIASSSKPRL